MKYFQYDISSIRKFNNLNHFTASNPEPIDNWLTISMTFWPDHGEPVTQIENKNSTDWVILRSLTVIWSVLSCLKTKISVDFIFHYSFQAWNWNVRTFRDGIEKPWDNRCFMTSTFFIYKCTKISDLKWIKSHHSAHSQKTSSFESFLVAFWLDATGFYAFEPITCMKTVMLCHFARIWFSIITTKMMKIGENCNFGIF